MERIFLFGNGFSNCPLYQSPMFCLSAFNRPGYFTGRIVSISSKKMRSSQMDTSKTHPVFCFIRKYKLLLAVILLGFLLRLFQLGNDILWYDEVGVFGVTKARNLADIVPIVQSHVMAMPLDYVFTWLASRIGTSNAILRFPSVIWGTLTLPVCYFFFKELTDQKTALYAVFLLAISPFHIQYSQELRFYSSLTLFYVLSTYTLYRAMKNPTARMWSIFTITTVIGVFFHMYVLLVLVNGLVWFLFSDEIRPNRQMIFRHLLWSATVILLSFAIGFFLFSGRVTFANPFLETGISFWQTVFTGLGWLPFYSNSLEWSWVWGLTCCLLQIGGLIVLLKKPRSSGIWLMVSVILQMAVIMALDVFKQYFFMPRQWLPFLPVLLMTAGIGLSSLNHWLQDRFSSTSMLFTPQKRMIPAILVCLILLIDLPALVTYYSGTKGNADGISAYIHTHWLPGSMVLVINPYEAGYYNFFFDEVIKDSSIVPSVWQADWQTVQESTVWKGKIFVITPLLLSMDQQNILESSGYKLIPLDYHFTRYSRQLWIFDH